VIVSVVCCLINERIARSHPLLGNAELSHDRLSNSSVFTIFLVETPFYLQSVYMHSANWCEDWVLWLGERHSVVIRVMSLVGRGGIILTFKT
jgi:hypothetical protein